MNKMAQADGALLQIFDWINTVPIMKKERDYFSKLYANGLKIVLENIRKGNNI